MTQHKCQIELLNYVCQVVQSQNKKGATFEKLQAAAFSFC